MHPGVRSKVPRSRNSYEYILKNGYAAKLKLPPQTKSDQQLSLYIDVRDQSILSWTIIVSISSLRAYSFELPKRICINSQGSFDKFDFHHESSGNRKESGEYYFIGYQ